jgi:hypothetical protein
MVQIKWVRQNRVEYQELGRCTDLKCRHYKGKHLDRTQIKTNQNSDDEEKRPMNISHNQENNLYRR